MLSNYKKLGTQIVSYKKLGTSARDKVIDAQLTKMQNEANLKAIDKLSNFVGEAGETLDAVKMVRESEDFKKEFEDMLKDSRLEKFPFESAIDTSSLNKKLSLPKPENKTLYKVFQNKQNLNLGNKQLPVLPTVGKKKKGSMFVERGIVQEYDPSQRREPTKYDKSQRQD
jgi:hypothetical protein|tara:strand:+ start:2866 stop:3375 length:510 start_codon:yes stop_codon:yes gene_type:complete